MYTHIRTHTHVHQHMYTHIRTQTYACICAYIHTKVHTCIHVCLQVGRQAGFTWTKGTDFVCVRVRICASRTRGFLPEWNQQIVPPSGMHIICQPVGGGPTEKQTFLHASIHGMCCDCLQVLSLLCPDSNEQECGDMPQRILIFCLRWYVGHTQKISIYI